MADAHYYELMILLDSNKYASDASGVTQGLESIFERIGAEVALSRPWQENKLAYPVNGNRKGLYYLVYYSMDPTQSNELDRLLRLNESVLRSIVIVHPKHLFEAMVEAIQSNAGASSSSSDEAPSDDGERGERRDRRRREARPAEVDA